jgi:low affinity Fe/Cu permease
LDTPNEVNHFGRGCSTTRAESLSFAIMETARKPRSSGDRFQRFATRASERFGNPSAFLLAGFVVTAWLVSGPIFRFSNAWQLVINTATTIVTFLMVFLIQATQNRDARAIHLKLDELIRSSKARNIFADLEDASEAEIATFREEFRKLRQQGIASDEAAESARSAIDSET